MGQDHPHRKEHPTGARHRDLAATGLVKASREGGAVSAGKATSSIPTPCVPT